MTFAGVHISETDTVTVKAMHIQSTGVNCITLKVHEDYKTLAEFSFFFHGDSAKAVKDIRNALGNILLGDVEVI